MGDCYLCLLFGSSWERFVYFETLVDFGLRLRGFGFFLEEDLLSIAMTTVLEEIRRSG